MDCHNTPQSPTEHNHQTRLLLMGNPNVGKSVIFSKLTGMDVLTANYTGTTVSYTRGTVKYMGKKATLIDVPGIYSLDEVTSPAEDVAAQMLEEGADAVICVLDASNLERNLDLAFQVAARGIPIVYALNLGDVARERGIEIDVQALESALGAPVIATVATRNLGLRDLLDNAWLAAQKPAKQSTPALSKEERWQRAESIATHTQNETNHTPGFWERLGNASLRPFPGLPIAAMVLLATMGLVVGGGKALRALVLLPLLDNYYVPFISRIIGDGLSEGIWQDILIGEYGVLIKGIEWPFALILPYVFLFYVALSLMEDSGYMPRLGVLMDASLRRVGIQGANIVPFIMGYGCAVPAILGTRAATSYKERLMVTFLVALAVPCAAQTGAFIALLGDRSLAALIAVYMFSVLIIIAVGSLLNRWLPGRIDPMLLEIPNLLKPNPQALGKKIWLRTKHFMLEAEIPMLLGIAFAALVAETGILNHVAPVVEPLVVNWLGLPAEATLGLLLGVVRRELGVLPLLELDLTTLQLFTGAVVALLYVPCLSVFAVIIREFNLKVALLTGLFTIASAFTIAGLINQLGTLLIGIFS
ncbi:MAG: ferrous iron transporter B [Firmicutes bacterium]|nr:ferrous iron transporter B [Bacillota bacterium]